MARSVYETPINSETPREHLELCLIKAERTSDTNVQKAAARARAELQRREELEQKERLVIESKERVEAQRFQEGLIEKQIEAQEKWMVQQLEVAKDQVNTARGAEQAAKWSAVAAVAIVVLTAILVAIGASPLFTPDSSDMPAATTPPPATKNE